MFQATNAEKTCCDRDKQCFTGFAFDTNYAGVNVNPSLFDFIGINPFAVFSENISIPSLVETLIHMLFHEYTHCVDSYHGDWFVSSLCKTYAMYANEFWFQGFIDKLIELAEKHINIIREYIIKYRHACNVHDDILLNK